ncbi:TetR/AcrR family transcriptional regulator [Nocardia sp. NPDC088792]|uniref:TetR/AcrR family transcriptional regulator n=1 Tax=Nocardia sp. NPDC088792 TaxID=3364332 RepID=UPI0037FB9E5A
MSRRREQVLDAAIEVMATEGLRGLTFQAVDKAAEVPAGSASNSFRNRNALLLGIVTHLVELDERDWQAVGGILQPNTPDALADMMAGVIRHALGPGRSRTTARYALFLEAATHPDLRAPLTAARQTITTWITPWLQTLGSPDPTIHCNILLDHTDGAILHQITWPDPNFNPTPGIRALLSGLLDKP